MSDHLTPSDRTFMRHFAIMIAALGAVAVGLAIIGMLVHAAMPEQTDTAQIREAGERIMPLGANFSGSTGRAAMLAQQAAAAKAAASQVAYGGTTDGKTIYGQLCHSCHDAGVTGAPKLGNKGDCAGLIDPAQHPRRQPGGRNGRRPRDGRAVAGD